MKIITLTKKSEKELTKLLNDKQVKLRNARFEHKLGGLKQSHLLRTLRREIAQIRTLLHAKNNHDK